MSRHPFWSDDFDMDLLKLFPNLEEALGPTANTLVWTLGHTTNGRLNHPTVWNTHGAFLWVHAPKLERDKRGWVNVQGCVTDAPVVECSWLEWLRDCWAHHFNFAVLPAGQLFVRPLGWGFERLMWHIRAWDKKPREETVDAHVLVWEWLGVVNHRFAAIQDAWCMLHEGTPCYEPKSVPNYIEHKCLRPFMPDFGSSSRAEKRSA